MARMLLDTTAEVTALMGPGVDPHLYKASQGDLAAMRTADLVLYNGLHLEGKLNDVLERLGKSQTVVALGPLLPDSLLRTSPDFPGTYDPHIWFDVALWRTATLALADTLTVLYPEKAETIQAGAQRYATALAALDSLVRAEILSIQPQQRVLVTAHDAFGYFGRRYGIEVRGLQGISTLSEFGIQDMEALTNFLVSRRIKAIFVESSVSPRSIEALVANAKARGHLVRIGGTLYSDALGETGTPAGSYIGMVETNVQTIVEALK